MKLCKPFKGATIGNITQGFIPKIHEATDWSGKYGCWLTAPENIIIERIATAETFDDKLDELQRGYGIVFYAVANPLRRYSYWHCAPIFPCEVGQTITSGSIIAQMSNSGFVMSNGYVVPLEDRTKYPFAGSHLHLSMGIDGKNVNFLDYVNWETEPNYTWLDQIKAMTNIGLKMLKLIK